MTGVVTRNMSAALRATYDATPEPKVVIAIGDCACDGGMFAGATGVEATVGDSFPVTIAVAGLPACPGPNRHRAAAGHRSMTAAGLAALVAGGGVAAGGAIPLVPRRICEVLAGALTALLGALGVALGASVITVGLPPVQLSWLLPLAGVTVAGDAMSGYFIAITGAVAVAVGVYSPAYFRHARISRETLTTVPVFVAAMLLLPLAASVTTFAALWELMALSSLVLMLAEHREPETRRAALVYAVMTELGFLVIVLALVTFAAGAHTESFAGMGQAASALSPGARAGIFLLSFVGFGSKAGLVPLHAWLARAHPAAPSPVSALLSAAMVNLGIYGMLRVDVALLGPGPRWWGLLLVLVGAATALYAVLQASVANDLKRLLAFSTSENMGLITIGIGAALMLSASHNRLAGQIAMTAALLHVANHAAFKTLGFLSAGAVVARTGTRDLDRLGGLAHRMPVTSMLFGIAALGASGLPLGAGFVSEWLLLQGLIHALPASGVMLALAMPVAVAAVALTAGLGVAAMVKAFGVGFLARPRSEGASAATEVGASMLAGGAIAAIGCAVLAVAPALLSRPLAHVLHVLPSTSGGAPISLGTVLTFPGIAGSLSPTLLAAAFAGAVVVALAAAGLGSRGRPATRPAELWRCGGPALTPRMQYTSASFAEPLQRVFDDVLRPDTDVDVSHLSESRYLVAKVTYRSVIRDAIEERLYRPVIRAVNAVADLVRRRHTGSVNAYLGFGMLGLLVVLVVAR